MTDIRLVLADDHELFRNGLGRLLRRRGMEVVGEVDDGYEAIEAVRKSSPDVVLMDVSMPVVNGIEATRWVKQNKPSIRVLCVSIHDDREFVLSALQAGADGYVVKDCSLDELVNAIETVRDGHLYLSPRVARSVVDAFLHDREVSAAARSAALTGREAQVLSHLADGQSMKAIAALLFVSEKTIGNHRRHIMDKLGIHSVAGLTKYAIRRGLTSADG